VSAAVDGDEPPVLMTRLRDRIREVTGAYRDLVVVEHRSRAEGDHRAGDGPGYAAYGWGTRLTPRAHGQSLDFWYDGLDVDLVAAVGDVGWFEWRDLTDEDAVLTEAVGLCAGVLAGNVWEWRALRTRGCEVRLPDGRLIRATRHGWEPWLRPAWGTRRVLSRRRLVGYRRT
jgi:hypothetical protein